jgi:uncharacterized repeat protein (TIGR01451 family)
MKIRRNVYHACFRRLACIAMLFLLGTRAMALTPAGTEIRNQSVATYKDANDLSQISTSNEVINIVAPLYGLEITPNKDPENATPFNYADDPALEQTTAPGNIAYYHYYLKNTGNTPDTYNLTPDFKLDVANNIIAPNKIEVYYDANGNGQVDAGDILLRSEDDTGTLNTAVPTPIVAQDATIPLIVAVHTPTNAAQTNADEIHTDINGASIGSGSTVTDLISNWNRTLFSKGTGILTATKGADVSSTKPGKTLTYTITGSNTGSAYVKANATAHQIDLDDDGTPEAREGILIIDELDPDKLLVDADYDGTSSSKAYDYNDIVNVTVFGPVTAKIVYWHEDDAWYISKAKAKWGDTPTTKKPKLALFIPDDDDDDGTAGLVLAPGQGYKFSFEINVQTPYNPAQPKLIENQVTVTYDDGTGDVYAESNKSLVTVGDDPTADNAGVAFGPFEYPRANSPLLNLSNTNHPEITKNLTVAANTDITSAEECNAGQVIVFPLTVLNPNELLGVPAGIGGPATSPDTYNITVACDQPGQADNFSWVLYKSDGITPLADTNGDGKPDTGMIAPAGMADIIVKVFIKANADLPTTATTFTATAISTNDPTKVDTTKLAINAVHPAGVDIATSGQLGKDDNATNATATANDDDDHTATSAGLGAVDPGAVITFPIDIGNMRPALMAAGGDTATSVADTYNLTFEKIDDATDASAFVVQLFKDASGDGVIDDDELVPISDTGWLAPVADVNADPLNPIFNLNVRVQVPAGTEKGTYYIDVIATSTNNPTKSDTMRLAIEVKDAPAIEVTPDNTATVVPGGTYIFSHVVTNTGNAKDDVTLTHSALASGYSAVWVDCTDGSVIGLGNPSTYTISNLEPNTTKNVCLKVFVPANAPAGSVVPITVTGTMVTHSTISDTALDVITVIDGALQLTKSRITSESLTDPAAAVPPGGTIKYTTKYKNLSPGTLKGAVISDALPANTELTGNAIDITAIDATGATINAQANNDKFWYSTNGGVSWNNFPAANFNQVTNIRVTIGDVKAGEEGNFVFTVKVK